MKAKLFLTFFLGSIFLIFTQTSCETEIDLNLPAPEPKIVVEGYIEQDRQPYVLLTRNAPYFGEIDLNDPESYLVRGATVIVSNNGQEEILPEICLFLLDLPVDLQQQILNEIGIPLSAAQEVPNICFYTSLSPQIVGQIGETYELRVITDEEELTARTKIPDFLTLDTIWYQRHEDPKLDSLFLMFGKYTDPDTIGNYIRYSSKRNREPFYGLWVIDDRLINGKTVTIPLRRGQSRFDEIDFTDFGYFTAWDTVVVRWSSIDKAHFDFWNTMEFEMAPVGPFATPTIIKSNIEGGLGIWGGAAVFYDTIVINPELAKEP